VHDWCIVSYQEDMYSVDSRTGNQKWNLISVLKFIFVILAGILAYFFGYLTAKHHTLEKYHLLSHCPAITSTNALEIAQSLKETADATKTETTVSSNVNYQYTYQNQSKIPAKFRLLLNPVYNKNPKGVIQPRALTEVFSMFHHPASRVSAEIVIQPRPKASLPASLTKNSKDKLYGRCETFYLTRTGSLEGMPNKCLAVALVSESFVDPIPHYHRRGLIAKLVNMYQKDYISQKSLSTENALMPMLLGNLDQVSQHLVFAVSHISASLRLAESRFCPSCWESGIT
jgi:hypothetical protein